MQCVSECLHWITLCLAQDSVAAGSASDFHRIRPFDPTMVRCLDALRAAFLMDSMPTECLLQYTSISYWVQALESLREAFRGWRDLTRVGSIITEHHAFCDRERIALERSLEHL